MHRFIPLLAILALAFAASCSKKAATTYAVGSTVYHAAPESCRVLENDGAIAARPDHYKAKDGKGLVFEVLAPGAAVIECGGDKTRIAARAAERIEIARTDGESGSVSTSDVYVPAHCLRAFDGDGKALEVGTLTQGVEFTTSDHLAPVADHGMGGAASSACLPQQSPREPGTARISVSWGGLMAQTTIEITAGK